METKGKRLIESGGTLLAPTRKPLFAATRFAGVNADSGYFDSKPLRTLPEL